MQGARMAFCLRMATTTTTTTAAFGSHLRDKITSRLRTQHSVDSALRKDVELHRGQRMMTTPKPENQTGKQSTCMDLESLTRLDSPPTS